MFFFISANLNLVTSNLYFKIPKNDSGPTESGIFPIIVVNKSEVSSESLREVKKTKKQQQYNNKITKQLTKQPNKYQPNVCMEVSSTGKLPTCETLV